jgi:hypothetical protein
MINVLPDEIIIKIFNYLDHEALMKVYNINNNYKEIIKNNVWPNITIKFFKNKRIQKFVDDKWINCFVKYELAKSEINNDYIKYFTHCSYLDLYKCYNLATNCTQYLTNCHTIDLSYTNIVDDDIKYLKNCHTVRLFDCKNLTNHCTEYLTNCYEVDLNFCNITDEGVLNLTNCKILRLGHTKITRLSIPYLTNCIELDISYTNINDDDLKYLESIENLNISYCKNINYEGIQYLKKIKILNVEMCFEPYNGNYTYFIEYIKQNYPYVYLDRSIPISKLAPEDQ